MVTMTRSATETSAGLMRLAADGDELAFAGIVDAHHSDMSSVCFVVTGGDAELTEEAVQSAWPIAWRKLHTIRDPERLRPWLISIAVNEARQLARRRAGVGCSRSRSPSIRSRPPLAIQTPMPRTSTSAMPSDV
jgi:DNA-directed RNA polymerase specialized sigma24 family protein